MNDNSRSNSSGKIINGPDSRMEWDYSVNSWNFFFSNPVPLKCNKNKICADQYRIDSKEKNDENDQECDLPKKGKLICICNRKRNAYECGRCHHYFNGRLSQICPLHTSEVYLMDFHCCPYCAAPIHQISVANKSWEEIRKFEEAELPGGDDGL